MKALVRRTRASVTRMIAFGSLLAVLGAGQVFVAAPPASAAAPPFTLYLPVPPGASVAAGSPHGDGGGVRNSLDFGMGGDKPMEVFAAHSGVFRRLASPTWNGATCKVIIQNGDWSTTYLHLINVNPNIPNNTPIAAGTKIGDAGFPQRDTCSTGDFRHVHLSLQKGGRPEPIDNTNLGGYIARASGNDYCGYWTKPDGAVVVRQQCAAGVGGRLANNLATPPYVEGQIARRTDPSGYVTWVMQNGQRAHIPNYQTELCAVYAEKRPVKALTSAQVEEIPERTTTFACNLNGKILRAMNRPAPQPSYAFHDNKRFKIPDSQTFLYLQNHGYSVVDIKTEAEILKLPDGGTEPAKLDAPSLNDQILRRADGVSWVVSGGVRRHIPDYPTDVCAEFFERRTVKSGLTQGQLDSIPENTSQKHVCALNNKLLRANDKPDPKPSWVYRDSKKYAIQDPWTYDYWVRAGYKVVDMPYARITDNRLVSGGNEPARLNAASIPPNSIIRRSDGVSWVVGPDRIRHHIPYVQDDVCWRNFRGYPVSATNLTAGQANALKENEAWPCTIGDKVVKSSDGSSHWVDKANARHAIPDVDTFNVLARRHGVVGPWPASEVNLLPKADTAPALVDPEAVKNSIICRSDNVCWVVDGGGLRHHIPAYADNVCWRWVQGLRVSRSGLSFGQADSLKEDVAWGCSMHNRIIATNEGQSFYMEGNTRRPIVDGPDFNCYAQGRTVIRGMAMSEAQGIPQGAAMPMCFGPGYRLVSIFANGNGRYVSAELGYGGADYGMLRARHTAVGGWEQFRLIGDCNSACAIQSVANRLFVTAEAGYQGFAWGELRARNGGIGGWEQFRLVGDCSTGCGIYAHANGRYVSAELDYTGAGYGMLRARAEGIGGWERFRIG